MNLYSSYPSLRKAICYLTIIKPWSLKIKKLFDILGNMLSCQVLDEKIDPLPPNHHHVCVLNLKL